MSNEVFLCRVEVLAEYVDAGPHAPGANGEGQGHDAVEISFYLRRSRAGLVFVRFHLLLLLL